MAKQNYIVGKKYLCTLYDMKFELTYSYGNYMVQGYNCSSCGKELNQGYCFIKGDIDNPYCQYFFGSECVKKYIHEI